MVVLGLGWRVFLVGRGVGFKENAFITRMAPVILTCFAGRERYLKVLIPYINELVKRKLVHEVHMWDYTRNAEDAAFLQKACSHFTILVPNSKEKFADYYKYYRSSRYPDPETVLIKCDDDIVYIDVSRFKAFVDARRALKDAVIFSPSIINNPVCGAIQLKRGVLPGFKPEDFDMTVEGGRKIHKYFLKSQKLFMKDSFATDRFSEIPWTMQWRFNINFIAILGKDLDLLFDNEYVGDDDELFLGIQAPRYLKRCIYIDMHFVAAHMAFTSQRNNGFDETPFLQKYADLVKNLV
jgi:hypothetical protein